MTRITARWIAEPAPQAVCAMLTEAGHQALFVGGCVRDALLNVPVGDIDIATDAHPEKVMALARDAGMKAVPTGIDHGTITVIASGQPFEITTFRRDVKTDGRRAVVAFAARMEDDALRRDFTMNALYARPDGTVLDPVGQGLADLAQRRFRFILDPAQRIREDYLRILRFFRFHAWYGDPDAGMETETLAAIAQEVEGIDSLSRERIGAEMRKLLSAHDPAQSVAVMAQCGALSLALPGADARGLGPLVHLEDRVAPDPIRRLAILGGEDPASALRLSKAEARQLALLRDAMASPAAPAELGYRHGAVLTRDILLLRAALFELPLDPEAMLAAEAGAAQVFPVRPADLMPALSGPQLGATLRRLEATWIASGFTLDRAALLNRA
ncbi:CCA tRNA nucleotidyltransferase [Pseudooceanicola aestuarii]|uniref:CCA tRNA nucleotidyltransferase n=1 Tax=Pseudooceanicola aestuarii TaxID=2697319 RepID=UPI0013D3E332|nr:CCA tRNA nucleotidyltransferase [Pseudooceanicola aestuarii]